MGRTRFFRTSSALLDQVVSSGSNLLVVILVLRVGDALTFGAFTVAVAVNGLVLGLMRATVGDIAILRIRRDSGHSAATADAAVTIAGMTSLVLSVALLLLGVLLPTPLNLFVIALGVLLPVIQVQDIQRYIAFGLGQPGTALRLDTVWLLAQLAATVPVLLLQPDPVLVMYAWGVGAAVSAGYGLVSSGRQWCRHGLGQLARMEQRRASTFFADYVLGNGMGQLAILGLTGILSLASFGLFRLVLTVVGAVINIVGGIRSLIFASIAGQSHPDARTFRLWAAATLGFGFLSMGSALILTVLPPTLGVSALGLVWLDVRPLLLLAGVAETLRVMTFPSSDFIRAHGSGRRLVLTRSMAGIGVAVGLLLGGMIAGVYGALLALCCVQGVVMLLWLIQVHLTSRRLGVRPVLGARPGPTSR